MNIPLAKMSDLGRMEGQPEAGLTVWLIGDTLNAYTRMGLSVSAAFSYLLAITNCSATSERIAKEMVLRLTRRPSEPADQIEVIAGAKREADLPAFRTSLGDDTDARLDLMEQLLSRGLDGVRCAPDADVLVADAEAEALADRLGAKRTPVAGYDFYQPK